MLETVGDGGAGSRISDGRSVEDIGIGDAHDSNKGDRDGALNCSDSGCNDGVGFEAGGSSGDGRSQRGYSAKILPIGHGRNSDGDRDDSGDGARDSDGGGGDFGGGGGAGG